jgi:hypothetical protein
MATPEALKTPRRRRRWFRLLAVLAVSVAIGFVITTILLGRRRRQSAFETGLQRSYPDFIAAARIVDVRTNAATPEQLLETVSRTGLQRLDDRSLLALIWLRAELAKRADGATCSALASGNPRKLFAAIRILPDSQQQMWAQLFDVTALSIVRNVPVRPPPSSDAVRAAAARAFAGLSSQDRDALQLSMDSSAAPSSGDGCAAARIFYNRLSRASSADAIIITRAQLY